MNGYVVERDNRYCAVIYEGLDPATERERRRWHPAGRNREEAERAAAALADQHRRRLPRGPFPAPQSGRSRLQHRPRAGLAEPHSGPLIATADG